METNFNPYEFLNVPENMTLSDFKDFCLPLLKLNHPDKGGNPEHFQKIKQSIKIITDNIKTGKKFQHLPKSHIELKKEMVLPDVKIPNELKDTKNFNNNFNEFFNKNVTKNDFSLLSNNEKPIIKEITHSQLINERDALENEISQKKIFEDGKFDTNVFNNLFIKTNEKSKELKEYKEPTNSFLIGDNIKYASIDSNFVIQSNNNELHKLYNGNNFNDNLDQNTLNELKTNVTDTSIITNNDRILMETKKNSLLSTLEIPNSGKALPASEIISKPSQSSLNNDLNNLYSNRMNFNKPQPSQPSQAQAQPSQAQPSQPSQHVIQNQTQASQSSQQDNISSVEIKKRKPRSKPLTMNLPEPKKTPVLNLPDLQPKFSFKFN